ncbi:MAG: four-helix bundle copper-binding protein [FCB group bacterium]|jgi:hypothetical protein|nr:four-helix bundle copper-binding protein [FCB group bacterium]
MKIQAMLRTHPRGGNLDQGLLQECVEACAECGQTCAACADACLGEDQVKMLVRCIRLNLDCAEICLATGAVLIRQTEANDAILREQLRACATACRVCGDECQNHADMHEHCRVCAESCRRCEEACNGLMEAISGRA